VGLYVSEEFKKNCSTELRLLANGAAWWLEVWTVWA